MATKTAARRPRSIEQQTAIDRALASRTVPSPAERRALQIRERIEACARKATLIGGVLQLEADVHDDADSPRLDSEATDQLAMMAYELSDELKALCGELVEHEKGGA